MSKRNISYIKPDDPEFIKVLKKQAGYDDRNHKFDQLDNADHDFVDDDEHEKPQVVVLQPGDLTAEEADSEQNKLDDKEKGDLSKVCFIPKKLNLKENIKRKKKIDDTKDKVKKSKPLLSFDIDEDDDNLS